MLEEKVSLTEITTGNKGEFFKKKKRKLSLMLEENDVNSSSPTSNVLKKVFSFKSSEPNIPGFLFYKNTKDYTKVVAEPGLLPDTPNIFEINKSKNEKPDLSESFLFNVIQPNSLSTNINDRFSQITSVKKKSEEKQKKKEDKIKKVPKQKIKEEKLIKPLKNKAKKEKKAKIKEQFKKKIEQKQYKNDTYEYKKSSSGEGELTYNRVDIYRVPEKEAIIFHMYYPSKFSFQGEYKITIIAGEVEVLGYTLSPSSTNESVNIYSPDLFTPLIVETKPVKQTKPVEEILIKVKDGMTESDYDRFSKKLKPEDSILFVTQIKSSFGIVINKYFDQPLFPKDFEDMSLMTKTLTNLKSIFNFKFSQSSKYLKKNYQWDRIPLGQCTTLCGGKGVGKSTLLKYYVNKFITLGEKVLCLDFDPGQPEFSFPGCLSAVIVDQPLVGPNFTHILDPVIMTHYGDIDVSPNPSKYLECVKCVIEFCKKNEDFMKMKWFVNTMGFSKGLGVHLMITILKLLKPDTVIQIKSSDYKNNYPFYLSPATVNTKSGFRSMALDDVVLSHDLRVIYSCAEINRKPIIGGLKRRQLRDLMSVSYFSKAVSPPFYNFNAVQPYIISFSKLYLGIDFYIDPNLVLKAFNGSAVSLSNFEPDGEEIFSVESEEDVYFKVVIKPSVAPSLGMGFVRGIDCQEKKFYVMTHLSLEALSQVNCLSLGRVCAPHSMFLKQEDVVGEKIYTAAGAPDSIHRVKRMFRIPAASHYKEKY